MLLGTHHFANPGHDVVASAFDDVLRPDRQRELDDLVSRLAAWRPDRIAVEQPVSLADTLRARFVRYSNGSLPPSRNEVVQIGFRLAKHVGLTEVSPIDDDSFLDFNDSLRAIERRRADLASVRDSVLAVLSAEVETANRWMRTATLRQILTRLNEEEALHRGNSFGMFGGYLGMGEGTNYGGPQYLSQWYARNINMAHNLTRVAEPGVQRILVIVGSGHIPPLRSLLDEAPQFCPISPLPWLR